MILHLNHREYRFGAAIQKLLVLLTVRRANKGMTHVPQSLKCTMLGGLEYETSMLKITSRVHKALMFGACLVVATVAGAGTNCETVFRLNEAASYQEGCFPPCMCPTVEATRFRGTFVVGPASICSGVASHDVQRIAWYLTIDSAEFEIVGSGLYRVIAGTNPPTHALDLDLSIDGGNPQHFFSGFVPKTSNDSSIDIPISINGQTCQDTVIVVNASPVPPESMLQYRLAPDSTYQTGCFGACECPLQEPRPLEGTLTLVKILDHGTYEEFAVPRADFVTKPLGPTDDGINLSGFGLYTLIQGFAGPAHVLDLRLSSNGGEIELFDNQLFNTDPTFPAEFSVVIDTDDQICFDKVLSLHAIWAGPIVFQDDFECGDSAGWSFLTEP